MLPYDASQEASLSNTNHQPPTNGVSTMSKHAWIIDHDFLAEFESGIAIPKDQQEDSEAGTVGPSNAPDDFVARLKAGEGREFQMHDDDNELYYTGRILTRDEDIGSEVDFAPLDDFGMPNAGATSISYKNQDGAFVVL